MRRVLYTLILLLCFFSSYAQLWSFNEKLVANDRSEAAIFGYSVAIDSNYAVIGAFLEPTNNLGLDSIYWAGAAYILERSASGNWLLQQKISASDRAYQDQFGISVAICGDNIVIGAPYEDDNLNNTSHIDGAGSAYIFHKNSNGQWVEQQKIIAIDRDIKNYFGYSVSISGDHILVGAPNNRTDTVGSNPKLIAGASYIFRQNSSGSWVQQQKLISSDRDTSDSFGISTSIDGNYAIIGAYGNDIDTSTSSFYDNAGSAYIFEKHSSSKWLEVEKLVASDQQYFAYYGYSVDIKDSSAIVGAWGNRTNALGFDSIGEAGAAYTYDRTSNGNWIESQKIVAGDRSTYAKFGERVAIRNNQAVIAAPYDYLDANGQNSLQRAGSTYLFERQSNTIWKEIEKVVAPDRALDDGFGRGIALADRSFMVGSYNNYDEYGANYKDRSGALYIYKRNQIIGKIYNDLNSNCVLDSIEIGIAGRYAQINPGAILVKTNSLGIWVLDSLTPGNYTITYDVSGQWTTNCPVNYNFTVVHLDSVTHLPSFGLITTNPCANPNVSISMPFIRPCVQNQTIHVSACNSSFGTAILDSATVIVQLDSIIQFQSSTIQADSIGLNLYKFFLGDIYPGSCINFTISAGVSCNALPGFTTCLRAKLFPVDDCSFDSTALPFAPAGQVAQCNSSYDNSSLQIVAYCLTDSVCFSIKNTGASSLANMTCHSPVRIYNNAILYFLDSVKLDGGDSAIIKVPADGSTWRLETMQHPLHPGTSIPNATIETCGNISNWIPGLVSLLPEDDADPNIDIFCGPVTTSYDPNDKNGYPQGIGSLNFIPAKQDLNYLIRFQNTGNDTAFTIIIRDTIDPSLNVFSVRNGSASHPNTFEMYGNSILQWTFSNILLPDSNVNESKSHGFVSFKVKQKPNLLNGTSITNSASIYFDFNAPILTNKTLHTVDDLFQQVSWTVEVNHIILTCDSFEFRGNYYSQSGTYYTVQGDTLHSIELTAVHLDTTVTQNLAVFTSNQTQSSYQWIDCDNGFSFINGATSQSYQPATNGSYAVIINKNNCVDTSACYLISNVGFADDNPEYNFTVYPNPTTGTFTIDLGELYDDIVMSLFNTYGQLIRKKEVDNTNLIELDVDGPAGMYFVKLNTDAGSSVVLRLVKQ